MRPEQSGKGRLTGASIALEGGTRFLLANQGRDKVRTTVSAIRGQADRFASNVQEATGTETRNL